jgi:tryptophan halogenase
VNVVVVGGGTAGWLTALYAKKNYPDYEITLIESEEIGILGAGEGSTLDFPALMDYLDISIFELLEKVKSTIKNAIKLFGWNSQSRPYYSVFKSDSPASNDNINFPVRWHSSANFPFCDSWASVVGDDPKDYYWVSKYSERNKVPFSYSLSKDGIPTLASHANVSMHFDATLLAGYLKDVGVKRGIHRVEGNLSNVVLDTNGRISEIKINDNSCSINCDFVFDCTGFARLIIGKLYKSEWKSCNDSLPVNSAIPFFLEQEEEITPYTHAVAMDYGWMWKIPLQHRFGAGYIFDSRHIAPDKAKEEVDVLLGTEVNVIKTIKFDAGHYKRVWIKNCLAVGLSAGFLEPLEATSIFQVIQELRMFLTIPTNFTTTNNQIIDRFNAKYEKMSQNVVDFLYLHYLTDKTNTTFWKDFDKNNAMPESVKYFLEVIKERPFTYDFDFDGQTFATAQFIPVLLGTNYLSKKQLANISLRSRINRDIQYRNIRVNQDLLIEHLLHHNEFIEFGKELNRAYDGAVLSLDYS